MPLVQGNGDIAVYTLDGASQLGIMKGVGYTIQLDDADTTTVARAGKRRQSVKKSATITSGFMSPLSGDAALVSTNLAVSAFTVGGVDYLAYLRGGSVKGSFDVREVSGVAAPFKFPQIFGKDYSADITLILPVAGASQVPNSARVLGVLVHDPDLTDQDLSRVTMTVTIDGTAITIPMQVMSLKHDVNGQQEQIITLSLAGNDPGTGAYPTAPTGSTSLLEKFFNAYNTALAVVLTTGAVASGETYSGNFIVTDFGFSFNDAEVIMIDYTLSSQGTVTGVAA